MEILTMEIEKKRIYRMLESFEVPQKKIDYLEPVIDEVAFMRVKLVETHHDLEQMDVAIPYDNGGGQTGIRENPQFKAYESLLKSYLMALDRIIAVLPKDVQESIEENTDKENVLELVRSMHKKSV